MNPDIAENLLRVVMGDAADEDFPDQLGILRTLANYKYDDYQQYGPGRQFIECLALWLAQFSTTNERRDALRYVRERLIYISDNEMRHLVSLMARDRVPAVLRKRVAVQLGLPNYQVVAVSENPAYKRAVRTSLFLGMSDGARIDQFRRNNVDLSNEQIAMTYELSSNRAIEMMTQLRAELQNDSASFEHIFLVDDFAGSGKTILRKNDIGIVEGRLVRFINETLQHLSPNFFPKIFIALYIATDQAISHLESLIAEYESPPWLESEVPEVVAVMTLNDNSRLIHGRNECDYLVDSRFDEILHQHYDESVEDEHKGRVLHGFSDCGLPLVLSHNTPNNSVYLLWERRSAHALFPRFERHQSRLGDV